MPLLGHSGLCRLGWVAACVSVLCGVAVAAFVPLYRSTRVRKQEQNHSAKPNALQCTQSYSTTVSVAAAKPLLLSAVLQPGRSLGGRGLAAWQFRV